MPFADVATFVSRLRTLSGVSARCLEFTILTAARTNESIKAKPEEFDLDNATWTIPASRMKPVGKKQSKESSVVLQAAMAVRPKLRYKAGGLAMPGDVTIAVDYSTVNYPLVAIHREKQS